ncbi:hypothetical protein BKA81DRAFT_367436 [Phyllosticta paracitricarpa]
MCVVRVSVWVTKVLIHSLSHNNIHTSQPPFDLEAPPTRLRRSYHCRLALCEEAVCQPKRPRCSLTLPHRSWVTSSAPLYSEPRPFLRLMTRRLRGFDLPSFPLDQNAQSPANASGQLSFPRHMKNPNCSAALPGTNAMMENTSRPPPRCHWTGCAVGRHGCLAANLQLIVYEPLLHAQKLYFAEDEEKVGKRPKISKPPV